MSDDYLTASFRNVQGKALPIEIDKSKRKRKLKPKFNRKQQLRGQRAKDVTDARQREAKGFNSFGFRPKDK